MSNSYGDGSWRKRGRKWEYRFRIQDPTTGMKVYRSVSGDTKDECREAVKRLRREVKASGTARPTRSHKPMTLGEWSEMWRADILPSSKRKRSTRNGYDSLLRNHLEGTRLAKTRLSNVTGLAVETHIESRELAASSKRSLHAAIEALFKDAVRDRRLDTNPMVDAQRPKKPTVKRATQARALSDQEVIRILDATKDHNWHALIVLALHTGMRRGELAGLRWSDIDFNTDEIHVQQQHNVFDEDDDLKSIHSDRIIPISRTARAALMDHGINETDRHATLSSPHVDRVFTGKTGQPIDLRSMSRWYNQRAKEAQLSDTGWHAFRHTFASRALAAGVPITNVSEWLGHSDPSITLALYSWALPGEKSNKIDLLDQHLNDLNT